MKIWPWSRFAAYEEMLEIAHLSTANVQKTLAEMHDSEIRWKKRYKGASDLLHERQAAFTQAQTLIPVLEERLRSKDFVLGRMESDLSEARMELRTTVERLGVATLQLQNRQITIPRDIFDEDPRQPDEFLHPVGPDALEVAEKMLTAQSWKPDKDE